ncbi:MAG TPA: hypothetical protein VFI25_07430 [Planctomycetota bacterium]|nr:hypothetical protein [Planctomycetota bacterium]
MPTRNALAVCLGLLPLLARGGGGVCPYCRGDPALLAAAGLVSHGPFPFAKDDTQKVAAFLAPAPFLFLESAHFRIGSSLEATSLNDEEDRRLRPELALLRKALPAVPARTRRLDPWLRLHLYALRAEAFYGRFQRILGVTDADFPATRDPELPYMGDGRYLGEREKYEILLHATAASHGAFLVAYTATKVRGSERWHFQERHAVHVSVPCVGTLRREENLHPHLVHSLAHMLLAGYKHYSYEPPLWIDEGLAHLCEREVDPKSNTFDGDEGIGAPSLEEANWEFLTLRIVGRGKAEPLANLLRKNAFSDLDLDDNVVCWSKVDFLLRTRPKELAALLGRVKGRIDAKGRADARDLPGAQREAFREVLGWSFADFDREWEAWVRKAYAPR